MCVVVQVMRWIVIQLWRLTWPWGRTFGRGWEVFPSSWGLYIIVFGVVGTSFPKSPLQCIGERLLGEANNWILHLPLSVLVCHVAIVLEAWVGRHALSAFILSISSAMMPFVVMVKVMTSTSPNCMYSRMSWSLSYCNKLLIGSWFLFRWNAMVTGGLLLG